METRQAALARMVAREVMLGGRIEAYAPFQAVIVHGRRPDHLLHALLSLLTFGFWLVVWAIVAMSCRERRTVLTVDERGQVYAAVSAPV